MSQRQALQALDATMAAAFVEAGIGDVAEYFAPDGSAAVPCRVLVDDEAALFGGDDGVAPVAGHRTMVTLFLAEVPVPRRGAQVVVAGDATYRLNELELRDQSRERWVVTRG